MTIDQFPLSKNSEVEPWYSVSTEKAIILHTQRLSTEDGPGIRTTVFFKGCPLHCAWCHNPESISSYPQAQWLEVHCIGCGICMTACSKGCLQKTSEGIVRDRVLCTACGKCAEECPAGAQEILGREIGLQELLSELLKDRVYYEKSSGGVTLSGGEPLMQPHFSLKLLKLLKENNVNTAIDTCGQYNYSILEKVLPYTDLILYDLKEIDPLIHKEFTVFDNHKILDNLLLLRDYLNTNSGGPGLWIRTPLIPGATANKDTIARIGQFIHTHLEDTLKRWELCAFNNLCRDKYRRLGLDWKFESTPLISKKELAELEETAKQSLSNNNKVFATGATLAEN